MNYLAHSKPYSDAVRATCCSGGRVHARPAAVAYGVYVLVNDRKDSSLTAAPGTPLGTRHG